MRYLALLHEHRQVGKALRYLLLSGQSFALNFGLTVGLHEWVGLAPDIAFGIALATVFVVNFLMMRFFVYRATGASLGSQLTGYLVSAILFRFAEQRAFVWLHAQAWLPYQLTIIIILGLSTVVKFFYWGAVVFVSPRREIS